MFPSILLLLHSFIIFVYFSLSSMRKFNLTVGKRFGEVKAWSVNSDAKLTASSCTCTCSCPLHSWSEWERGCERTCARETVSQLPLQLKVFCVFNELVGSTYTNMYTTYTITHIYIHTYVQTHMWHAFSFWLPASTLTYAVRSPQAVWRRT